MHPFLIEIQNFWAWGGRYTLGHLGIFGRTIRTHFGTVSPLFWDLNFDRKELVI